jgi:uncharacterized protein (UPF0548 family)
MGFEIGFVMSSRRLCFIGKLKKNRERERERFEEYDEDEDEDVVFSLLSFV